MYIFIMCVFMYICRPKPMYVSLGGSRMCSYKSEMLLRGVLVYTCLGLCISGLYGYHTLKLLQYLSLNCVFRLMLRGYQRADTVVEVRVKRWPNLFSMRIIYSLNGRE